MKKIDFKKIICYNILVWLTRLKSKRILSPLQDPKRTAGFYKIKNEYKTKGESICSKDYRETS